MNSGNILEENETQHSFSFDFLEYKIIYVYSANDGFSREQVYQRNR